MKELSRNIFVFALLTAGLLISMFVISLITGVNQQYIETVHALADYESALIHGESTLRLILTLDGLFIASYWLLGIFLVLALWKEERKLLLALSVACISVTAILDIIENSEFLMFMESLHNDLAIEGSDLQELMVTSSVKWYFAYFAFLFLGFAFPNDTAAERAASFLMKFIVLPSGILVFTIPASPALFAAHIMRLFVLLALLFLLARVAHIWRRNVVSTT